MSADALATPAGQFPDTAGHFGRFGGRFGPEALVAALYELDGAWRTAMTDDSFRAEFGALLLSLKRKHDQHRAEHLLLDDLRFLIGVDDQGR